MKVGFIGCGNMAKAMISGLLKSGVCKGEEVVASDVSPAARSAAQALGISVTADNRQAAAQADALVLAVKPQFYQEVIEGLKDSLRAGQLVITIAPGKTLAWLQERLGEEIAIVRTMPNTPAMVGEGITAMCPNGKVTEEQLALCRSLLESFGKAELVPERLMDAVAAARPPMCSCLLRPWQTPPWRRECPAPRLIPSPPRLCWAVRKWCWKPAGTPAN